MRTGQHSATRFAVLAICIALATTAAVRAGESTWRIELEPIYMQASGHDQHVLTVHQIGQSDDSSVHLDTEAGPAYRVEVERTGAGKWGWGVDFLWFDTTQGATQSTPGAAGVVFEVADHQFASTDPSETLFYSTLEDTAIAMWTLDLLAIRTLTEATGEGFDLLLGVRSADFDNDYRAVSGILDVEGVRFDASSNYGRMTGALVGLTARKKLGRSLIEGSIRQSVVFGTAELSNLTGSFTGSFEPFSGGFEDLPEDYQPEELVRQEKDVTIPISELRLKWTYEIARRVAVGAGVETSVWWDVPVPPGVIPGQGTSLHESTIKLFGLFGSLSFTF